MTSAAANKYPAFFKVFLPKLHSERLLIPIAFVSLTRFEERVPNYFILRNYSGRGWQVEARRIGEKLYFDHGWKQFVQENCLEKADSIVFEYDGRNGFKFRIYELDGCQKIGVKNEGENDCRIEEEEESNEEEEEEESEEEEEEEEKEEDSDDESEEEHVGRRHPRAHKAPVVGKRGTAAGSSATNNCGVDAEKYVQSDNPYFITKLNKYRPNELHIPKTLIDDFSLSLPQMITLLCCQHNGRNEIPDHHLTLPEETHNRKTHGMVKKSR